MKKSRLVLCPFCDNEQRIALHKTSVVCSRCGEVFEIEMEDCNHPPEFWHNPHTSHSF